MKRSPKPHLLALLGALLLPGRGFQNRRANRRGRGRVPPGQFVGSTAGIFRLTKAPFRSIREAWKLRAIVPLLRPTRLATPAHGKFATKCPCSSQQERPDALLRDANRKIKIIVTFEAGMLLKTKDTKIEDSIEPSISMKLKGLYVQ